MVAKGEVDVAKGKVDLAKGEVALSPHTNRQKMLEMLLKPRAFN